MGKTVIDKTVKDKNTRNKKLVLLIGGLILWSLYQLAIGASGFLTDFSLPPRFLFCLVLPAFLFTGIFLSKNRKKAWIMAIPESWLTYIQSFRILVETLFVYSVSARVLHPIVTIEGYNFDMVFGASALLIWFFTYRLKIISKPLLIIWNYLGIAVLASVIYLFVTSVYFPNIYGLTEMMPKTFATAPYVLVAGFLMPLAIFIHVLSIIRLRRELKK
tara:strand:+ start:1252 stop:1902 length:651 start_codon:yes stop_codon:yes gene_type:complete